jgi:opacity protein-like surface antigen
MGVRPWLRLPWGVGALLVAIAVSTAQAEEKPWSRAYRGELYPIIQMLSGDTVTGFNGTVQSKTEDSLAFGAGMGLNLTDHLNVNTDLLAGHIDTVASIPQVAGAEADIGLTAWLWHANLDYNILKSRLTPLVTGGLGFVKIQAHPENIDETRFSYNVGVGGRWDIADRLALRVTYRWTWTKIEDADDPFLFKGVAANLIFMFK